MTSRVLGESSGLWTVLINAHLKMGVNGAGQTFNRFSGLGHVEKPLKRLLTHHGV
jgi:hypothetical protein